MVVEARVELGGHRGEVAQRLGVAGAFEVHPVVAQGQLVLTDLFIADAEVGEADNGD